MTWISLVCLLAISSSAFARNLNYGGSYGAQIPQVSSMNLVRDFSSQQELPKTEITQIPTGYGQQYAAQSMIRRPVGQFDQSYSKVQVPRTFPSQMQLLEEQKQKLQQIIDQSVAPTEADILCRGQRAETVIPLDNNRRFVVCLDESKGFEQQCPRGLVFHPESRRCERKLGPLENPCTSQPCLNNGQCIQTDFTSYKCQCAPGFDGEKCELDARVCQTQQPCGQSPDVKCQSFREGAALEHICILQGGQAYGLTASQAQPSPCKDVDGTFPLAFSDKGFIMCNGDLMYVESCPGGTVWDDLNKACVWPDMQGLLFEDQTPKTSGYGASSYGSVQRPMVTPLIKDEGFSSYGQVEPKLIKDERFSSYGQVEPKLIKDERFSSYGQVEPKLIKDEGFSSYGQVHHKQPLTHQKLIKDEEISSYGQMPKQMFTQPKLVLDETSSYGSKIQMPVQQDLTQQSFGGYQQQIPKQMFTQPMTRQQDFIRPQQPSGY